MKNCIGIILALITLEVLADSPTSISVSHDSRFTEIRRHIQNRVADDIPSFSISVIHEGEILWEEAFGWADIAKQEPATTNSSYSIASVAKSITSTGVMLLAEQGVVNLDHSIDVYIDEDLITPLSGSMNKAKVRDLLTMTAGFPMGFVAINSQHPVPERQDLLRHHGGLQVFPPGEVFHYSNFSLGLAEIVVEQATGNKFDDAMRDVIFEPAGMNSSFFSGSRGQSARMVTNYDESGEPLAAQEIFPAGGAGAYSSVSDLRRYALAHLGYAPSSIGEQDSPLISDSVRKAMQGDYAPGSDDMFATGFWVVDLGENMNVVVSDGHGTAMALVQLIPDRDLAVICLMSIRKNDADGQPLTNKVAKAVTESLLPGFSARYDQFRKQQAGSKIYKSTPATLGRWTGYIRAFDGSHVGIEMLFKPDGEIQVSLQDQYTVLLAETQFAKNMLQGWFLGFLPNNVSFDQYHDILARIQFKDNKAQGYVNANFSNQRGTFELSNYIYLERD